MKSVTELNENSRVKHNEFFTILFTLNRRTELTRLVAWATRKRLVGPRRLYEKRLMDEEVRLARYSLQSPTLVKWVQRFHWFNNLILPAPQRNYFGSASHYRIKRLTTRNRKTYSY